MIIELMTQHYLTSPNVKNIIKSRKIAYLGAKFFLAPCFFMLVCAISWEQRKLGECVTFLDTMRKPLKESEREKGIYPYYGASGIVDYVSDYIFDEELVLLSEDGANITDRNYPVCFLWIRVIAKLSLTSLSYRQYLHRKVYRLC